MTAYRAHVGITAPSSIVPPVEFEMGVERLTSAGFDVSVHPQCKKRHLFFAGTHYERAEAFFQYASDPRITILWCARGGHGANHLLPILEQMTREQGAPPVKLLAGYSDATALMEFVRTRWGWKTLHAPMPGGNLFYECKSKDWKTLLAWLRHEQVRPSWEGKRLKFAGRKPERKVRGTLVGGNLTIWSSLTGTPYEPETVGKILFFEDIAESPSRIDRMLQQMALSGALKSIQAIVLGDFLDCNDSVPMVLKSSRSKTLVPLRPQMTSARALREVFGEIAERLGIPVAYGLPVGHGPGFSSLPLGAEYELGPDGSLRLLRWDWLQD